MLMVSVMVIAATKQVLAMVMLAALVGKSHVIVAQQVSAMAGFGPQLHNLAADGQFA